MITSAENSSAGQEKFARRLVAARAHAFKSRLARKVRKSLRRGALASLLTKPFHVLRRKLRRFRVTMLISRLRTGGASETFASGGQKVLASLRRVKEECPGVSVVVPAYNAPEELSVCLRSVLRHTPADVRIIVIDDASPDSRVQDVLGKYQTEPRLETYRNEKNLGYTRTINRGIELAGRDDVVLLNSDTEVTPRWLSNLRLACYSSDRVGTATAMSNNAGAFSVPKIGEANEIPPWLTLDQYGRAISRSAKRTYPETPTGNGFCLYIRRACLDDTGMFDVEAFPRGYGEENDFCLRAGQTGWRHVVDDATIIRHHRSASFGSEKLRLMVQGRRADR